MNKCLFLIVVIAHCVNLLGQECSPDSLQIRDIRPFDTDNNLPLISQKHQVFINNDCQTNNKLLLHLVGSLDNPENTTYFPTLATNHGFKVINLKYSNIVSASGACANSTDINCFWKYRQEIIFGTDTSSTVSVDKANSIINRLEKLLLFLGNSHPSENWNAFLTDSGEINWPNIIVSGHSQGGGHAAFIAKQFEVDRVLMFASPNDYSNTFASPASWISDLSVTQDSNYFAFGHLFDNAVDFEKQYQIWQNMNLLNQVDSSNVDNSVTPFNNSNVLYSSTEFSGNHNAVIIDNFTPLSGGIPVFIPVWEYMLGVNKVITSTPKNNTQIERIKAFPNPTKKNLFIESEHNISRVEIYSLSGNLLHVVQPNSDNFKLDLSPHKGVVFLRILTIDYAVQTMKILVK